MNVTSVPAVARLASNSLSQLGNSLGFSMTGIPSEVSQSFQQQRSLMIEQMRIQNAMQTLSMQSNLIKSDHEARMAVINNLRVR